MRAAACLTILWETPYKTLREARYRILFDIVDHIRTIQVQIVLIVNTCNTFVGFLCQLVFYKCLYESRIREARFVNFLDIIPFSAILLDIVKSPFVIWKSDHSKCKVFTWFSNTIFVFQFIILQSTSNESLRKEESGNPQDVGKAVPFPFKEPLKSFEQIFGVST